eukprot:13558346-Alexandrium_andersonii.AAC.1
MSGNMPSGRVFGRLVFGHRDVAHVVGQIVFGPCVFKQYVLGARTRKAASCLRTCSWTAFFLGQRAFTQLLRFSKSQFRAAHVWPTCVRTELIGKALLKSLLHASALWCKFPH